MVSFFLVHVGNSASEIQNGKNRYSLLPPSTIQMIVTHKLNDIGRTKARNSTDSVPHERVESEHDTSRGAMTYRHYFISYVM